jgi:hypothetical protein
MACFLNKENIPKYGSKYSPWRFHVGGHCRQTASAARIVEIAYWMETMGSSDILRFPDARDILKR